LFFNILLQRPAQFVGFGGDFQQRPGGLGVSQEMGFDSQPAEHLGGTAFRPETLGDDQVPESDPFVPGGRVQKDAQDA
jgi:hypothetical protein